MKDRRTGHRGPVGAPPEVRSSPAYLRERAQALERLLAVTRESMGKAHDNRTLPAVARSLLLLCHRLNRMVALQQRLLDGEEIPVAQIRVAKKALEEARDDWGGAGAAKGTR